MARVDRKGRGTLYHRIDVPGNKLYCCFYCGCVALEEDHFPPMTRTHDYKAIYDLHKFLIVPCCSECNGMLLNSLQPDIYARFEYQKKKLTQKLSKFIRMGELWDDESLEYAQFEGRLKTSLEAANRMGKICQERIDWMHWPISVDGSVIEPQEESEGFRINGKTFLTIDHILSHASKVDKIPKKYLEAVIDLVGKSRVEFAYNLCKTNKIKSEAEMKRVLADVQEMLEDETC